MSNILADYREWREQQVARVSTHSDGCHMWHRECMIHRLADALAVEQAKRALTDAEREAIEEAAHACGNCNGFAGDPTRAAVFQGHKIAATLRGLLERTRNGSPSGCETGQ